MLNAISTSTSSQVGLLSPDKRNHKEEDDVKLDDQPQHDHVFKCMLEAQKERIEHLEQRLEQLEANMADQQPSSCSCEMLFYAILSIFLAFVIVFAGQHYFKILDFIVTGYRWDSL